MIPDAETLRLLELALARRDEATIPGGYASVLDDEFAEIGASGRRWTRAETLALLAADEPAGALTISRFEVSFLGRDLVLATYDVEGMSSDGTVKRTRRSSIWRRRHGAWRMRFNQGTPLPAE